MRGDLSVRPSRDSAMNPEIASGSQERAGMGIETEEWRPVLGMEGLYEVSSLGRVRSLDRDVSCPGHAGQKPYVRRIPGKLLSLKGAKNPYFTVYLPRPRGQARVHALVAESFIGPRPTGYETRHLNGDSKDNRAVNLAYGTVAENQRDANRHRTNKFHIYTHCPQGHEYTPENTYLKIRADNGWRNKQCKTCAKARATAHSRRKREERQQAS